MRTVKPRMILWKWCCNG